MPTHRIDAGPDTAHWGWFSARATPVVTVDSGDTVIITSVSGTPEVMPPDEMTVRPELLAIHDKVERKLPGHILTGPVAVRGAMPGDVLEVRILDVALADDWGYTITRPLAGALPLEVGRTLIHTAIDQTAGTGRLPWGTELKMAPFFGVMGVAPPDDWGMISTIQPRAHGGNLDNKELVAGTTLFLPVMAEGALFSCGDGHGVQGDGEVCVTAVETGLTGTFELHLHKGLGWDYPRAVTPDHLMTMGMHADLDTAAQDALRRMVDWITDLSDLTRDEALMLISLSGDVRVTQLVNEQKGSHVMMSKAILATLPGAKPAL
ncbi:amidase [Oceanicola sp. 22II-s10i]|uniref:acetamidase/formamidase family protein n=1 Tax=Oceanicola sp. 22II-s10i TaxID=1317116 RepID=UPI000B52891D|nr:acetamidase/formamidase family protein [Oceanicola sp. 22II-s10i]OWU86095.1 amidase [Oceanicola sp. 22II-s10i]